MAEDTTHSQGPVELLRGRGRHTRWFALAVFTLFLFAEPLAARHLAMERAMVALGNLLIVGGGLMRVYCALFIGGWNGKAMVIEGKWGGPLVRITYSANGDGSVRQFGEQSTDEGKSWAPSFDLLYRPRKEK